MDAYSADLYRLANLAGYNAVDDTDAMVVEQFLRGLPREFARQVRLAMAGQQLKVSTCSARVNALRTTEREFSGQRHAVSAAARAEKPAGKNVMCFQCGELGHIRRTCPKKAGSGRQPQCFFCDGIGHVKKDCPERRQWASEKASKVAAAAPGTKPPGSRTLCTVQGNRADLPRVFVDVQVNDKLCRVDATVDTGSMCTLVSSTAVEMLGLNVDDSGHPDDLVALDGSTVQVLGTAALCIQRLDGPVHLQPHALLH